MNTSSSSITNSDPADADFVRADLTAADVAWDLDSLIAGTDLDSLLDQSDALADQFEGFRGQVHSMTQADLARAMTILAELQEVQGRAGKFEVRHMPRNPGCLGGGSFIIMVQ